MIKLTVMDTSSHKITERVAINIPEIRITAMKITIGAEITGDPKIAMDIKITGIQEIEMTAEVINTITHIKMKEDTVNIPIITGIGFGFSITGIKEMIEIKTT